MLRVPICLAAIMFSDISTVLSKIRTVNLRVVPFANPRVISSFSESSSHSQKINQLINYQTFKTDSYMKTITLIFAMAFGLIAKANDDKFIEVMSKNIDLVYKAQTVDEIQKAVNAFDRIANSKKKKW